MPGLWKSGTWARCGLVCGLVAFALFGAAASRCGGGRSVPASAVANVSGPPVPADPVAELRKAALVASRMEPLAESPPQDASRDDEYRVLRAILLAADPRLSEFRTDPGRGRGSNS